MCDSHIGVSKQKVRRNALSGDPIETVEKFISVLVELNNTQAYDIGSIDRTLQRNCLQFNDGIKIFHEFTFDKNKHVCSYRELSGIGEWRRAPFIEINDTDATSDSNKSDTIHFILETIIQVSENTI